MWSRPFRCLSYHVHVQLYSAAASHNSAGEATDCLRAVFYYSSHPPRSCGLGPHGLGRQHDSTHCRSACGPVCCFSGSRSSQPVQGRENHRCHVCRHHTAGRATMLGWAPAGHTARMWTDGWCRCGFAARENGAINTLLCPAFGEFHGNLTHCTRSLQN